MTAPLTVVVVDDEAPARRRLRRMLEAFDDVEVVGEALDGVEALATIDTARPDLVFLDIRMPELDGLAVAHRLGGTARIVFTTAYDEYAVDAFETAAVDYLLKPIVADRLAMALERVRELRQPSDRAELEQLLRSLAARDEAPRVAARSGDTLRVFDPREIGRFSSVDGYTLFRSEGRKFVLDESVTTLEKRLAPHGFLRVHRHELINLERVRAILKIDDVTVVELADGQRASVSRRHVRELKRALGLA